MKLKLENLKSLAQAAISPESTYPVQIFRHDFTPAIAIELIAEIERLKGQVESLREGWYSDNDSNLRFWPEEVEGLLTENAHLQSELTKARELIARIVKSGALSHEQYEILESDCCALSAAEKLGGPECMHCHDQGEAHTGKMIDQGYWQPPEPEMVSCSYCSIARQSAPAAKCEACDGTGHDLNGGLNPFGGAADCLDCGGRGTAAKGGSDE